jgi:hypothetical protein
LTKTAPLFHHKPDKSDIRIISKVILVKTGNTGSLPVCVFLREKRASLLFCIFGKQPLPPLSAPQWSVKAVVGPLRKRRRTKASPLGHQGPSQELAEVDSEQEQLWLSQSGFVGEEAALVWLRGGPNLLVSVTQVGF